jgi:hypothetical protein
MNKPKLIVIPPNLIRDIMLARSAQIKAGKAKRPYVNSPCITYSEEDLDAEIDS